MIIYIEENYNEVSKRASDIILNFINKNKKCVLGLATGSTVLGTYNFLCKKYKNKEIKFNQITTFNLDEYAGLDAGHKQSYHYFMKKNLFSKTDIDIKKTFFPTDLTPNYKNYDKKIKEAGGIDLQILGIGRNGHIGFNEPNSSFLSQTREILLSKTTIKDNARFFNNTREVPKKAVTMGIDTIMKAKTIILLASGENKKQAILKSIFGPVSEKVPASILQRHKNVIVIIDKSAAGLKI